jgi:hypothetical protein
MRTGTAGTLTLPVLQSAEKRYSNRSAGMGAVVDVLHGRVTDEKYPSAENLANRGQRFRREEQARGQRQQRLRVPVGGCFCQF